MRSISPLDLRRSLGSILDQASAGQRFLIERDRRPLAVLISVEDAARLDESPDEAGARRRAAVEALEAFRDRVGRPPAGSTQSAAANVRTDRDTRDRRDRDRAAGVTRHGVD